ncbi:hypothetical protein PR048_028906 [Dryococelus australis]|uniref:Uncharacterized protein n=1 Tax=Dryococelus australis TaxID=614101 RepID=A0ABQ9GCG7_9NEOP|nr:hypothetical protein PR048_028906 [Dryococelus australis]
MKTMQQEKSPLNKTRILLTIAGKDVIDLAVTFGLGDKEFDNFDKLIEAFHNHVSSNQNETNKRLFGTVIQLSEAKYTYTKKLTDEE